MTPHMRLDRVPSVFNWAVRSSVVFILTSLPSPYRLPWRIARLACATTRCCQTVRLDGALSSKVLDHGQPRRQRSQIGELVLAEASEQSQDQPASLSKPKISKTKTTDHRKLKCNRVDCMPKS